MKIAIILAEFGKPAPDVSQYRECWPDANIGVYSEADCPPVAQFEGDRYGWRMNDYYSIRKALENESGAGRPVAGYQHDDLKRRLRRIFTECQCRNWRNRADGYR